MGVLGRFRRLGRLLIVVATLLHGLFDIRVDNKDIFAVVGPAFQSVIGGFVSLLGGITGYIVGKTEGRNEQKAVAG